MREKITKVYPFDELSEEAKEKAIDLLSDINVDYDWWECLCEEAKEIGLVITEFNLCHGHSIKGHFTEDAVDVANMIIKNHGKTCETYQDARDFFYNYAKEQVKFDFSESTTKDDYTDFEETEVCQDLVDEFCQTVLEDYRIILQEEYEYLTSEEAIIECIKANDYEFTEEGLLS